MLAAAVAAQTGREVSWRAVARGTTSRTARDLVPGLTGDHWRPDVVVVLIGVNDLRTCGASGTGTPTSRPYWRPSARRRAGP